jgi:HEAT repeat protein
VPDPVVEGRTRLLEAIHAVTVACRTRGAYPPDHPTVRQAVARASARLGAAVAALGPLALGVGRTYLRVGLWTLDSPQAQALAQALYVRQVAVLHVDGVLEPAEVEALVTWLAGPADPVDPGTAVTGVPGMPHVRQVRIQPLDYSALRLVDEAEPSASTGAVSLADRLLNALLEWSIEGGGVQTSADARASPETAVVAWLREFLEAQATPARERAAGAEAPTTGRGAAAIAGTPSQPGIAGLIADPVYEAGDDRHAVTGTPTGPPPDGDEPPPGPLPGELLVRLADATAAHLASTAGAGRALAARQTARLLLQLPEALRESLVRAAVRSLALDPAGEEALLAFAGPLGTHPALRALRQLSAEGVPLSPHAQRLVELLASTRPDAPTAEATVAPTPEAARAELLALFRAEDIDRYNPDDHMALIAGAALAWPTCTPVALGTPERLGDRVASLADDAVTRRLAETLLDLLDRVEETEDPAPLLRRLEQLVDAALARSLLEDAIALIDGLRHLAEAGPEPRRAAIRRSLEHCARVEALAALAAGLGASGGEGARQAVQLVRLLGPLAIRSLLQVLADEPLRARRRRVFDLLAALGPDVVPEATRRLGDPAWYVVRNVIALLRAVGDRTSLPSVERLVGHPDLRVRLEALRSLLALDPAVGHRRLLATLHDPDPRVATAAAELAGQHGSPDLMEPLLRVLGAWDLRGRRRSVRVAALHALGRIGRPEVLPRLARFFRDWGWPPASVAERRAAFESLQGYPPDARAAWVARGLRSRDPEVRTLCSRLRGAGRETAV